MGRIAGSATPGSEAPSKYHLAYIEWPGEICVSTMELTTLLHLPDGQASFETWVSFPGDPLDQCTWRTPSAEEALATHNRLIDRVTERMRRIGLL